MLSIIIGGLSVKIVENCSLHQLFAIEHRQHFFDCLLKEEFLPFLGEVYVIFSLLPKEFSRQTDKIIFSNRRSFFLKTSDNTFQLLHFTEDGNSLLWCLDIDAEFSSFNYKLLQKATFVGNELYELAFNRFLFQHTFINHHGLIIHAAGGSINGKGMVFPAISGTGKSTLSHLLLPHSENQLFSEERIIMRRLDDGWHLWGTPWKGTGVIARNESAPLSALVFISQAPETKISKLPPSAALRRLLETVSIPWYSQEWTDKGLAICESLLRAIPAYELAFRPDQTAVQAVAELAASLD